MSPGSPIVGVILAGGLARRMGGADKPLVEVAGRPMLARVIERLRLQVDALAINANGDPTRFSRFGLPVVADTIAGFAGPLAGILAGMRWAQANMPDARTIVSVAADTPFFPADFVHGLLDRRGAEENVALAASADGVHPVFGLWPIRAADDLEEFLRSAGTGKILVFADRHGRVDVPFPDIALANGDEIDPFFNVNTPEEAARAEKIARALDGAER